jgi:hypothetical protein
MQEATGKDPGRKCPGEQECELRSLSLPLQQELVEEELVMMRR